jgi:hypothetical protein
LKELAPKEEVLATVITEVEHLVNSRLLTFVSSDPSDLESLTPTHFLIGSSSGVQSPGLFAQHELMLRKQWRILQYLIDQFWRRWTKEYLPTVVTRRK